MGGVVIETLRGAEAERKCELLSAWGVEMEMERTDIGRGCLYAEWAGSSWTLICGGEI